MKAYADIAPAPCLLYSNTSTDTDTHTITQTDKHTSTHTDHYTEKHT